MKHIIEIRGRVIAVHAKTGAQLSWYRQNYAMRSDAELDAMAADTAISDRRSQAELRRASFYVV